MNEQLDLRKMFLEQFIREIFVHAAKQESTKEIDDKKEIETISVLTPEVSRLTEKTLFQAPPISIKHAGEKHLPLAPIQSFRPIPPRGPAGPLPYKTPPIYLKQRPPPPKVYLAPLTESWLANMDSLKRIQPLLIDQTITTIECPGPGMPIMISRGSYVQSTPVHFNADEITGIIRDVSTRTKIPLNPTGIFKAAIGDIIITAVLSEFAGTRFVIQKKPRPVQASSPNQPPRRR